MVKTSFARRPSATLDPAQQAHFAALEADWWNKSGPLRSLHDMTPARLTYIRQAIREGLGHKNKRLEGLSILDLGCGGGLLSEALASLGAKVTGLDATPEAIKAAQKHAKESKLKIDYRVGEVENFKPKAKFDVVIASEVIEHVAEPALFISEAARCLKKGGVFILSAPNRTLRSLALGVVMAEHVLRLLPVGTHDWRKFLKPSEVVEMLEACGLEAQDVCGLRYNPLTHTASLSPGDAGVQYLLWAQAT